MWKKENLKDGDERRLCEVAVYIYVCFMAVPYAFLIFAHGDQIEINSIAWYSHAIAKVVAPTFAKGMEQIAEWY